MSADLMPRGQWDPAPFLFCQQQMPHQEERVAPIPASPFSGRDLYLIDPNVMHCDESQTPGVLLTAILLQKWVTCKFLIDCGAFPLMTREINKKEFCQIRNSFLATQTSDGTKNMTVWDAELWMASRGLPGMPTVFQNGHFQPLFQTPYSEETKPIALFNMADDWAEGKSQSISRRFRQSFDPFYAEIAKHFTVVRVLVDDPCRLAPMAALVKSLIPGVPLALWSLQGHANQMRIRMGKRLLMTFSDVQNAFEKEVQTFLPCSGGTKEAPRVRMELLSAIASGKKRIKSQSKHLSFMDAGLMARIIEQIDPRGTIVLQGCSTAAENINITWKFSLVAPGRTVYGSPFPESNVIPKIFYSRNVWVPQFLPFFTKIGSAYEPMSIYVRAYRDGQLRADVSETFLRPLSTCIPGVTQELAARVRQSPGIEIGGGGDSIKLNTIPSPANSIAGAFTRPGSQFLNHSGYIPNNHWVMHVDDIERSVFMNPSTGYDHDDPDWRQLMQSLESPDSSVFKGGVCILAHGQEGCTHKRPNIQKKSSGCLLLA